MIKCLANKFLPTQPFKNGLGLTGIRLGALIFGLSGGLVAQLKQDLGQDVSEIKTSKLLDQGLFWLAKRLPETKLEMTRKT